MKNEVLSSCYFPPVSWWAVALRAESIVIDLHEHYAKQTWRNRCTIITANGLMNLVIPVKHIRNHTPVKDVPIDYSTDWQRVHWHAIRSAYGKSPYFEFYAELFERMFATQPEFLWQWNEVSIELIREALRLSFTYTYSQEYIEVNQDRDLRLLLTPGNNRIKINYPQYIQVFQERHGFQPDLSIIDLLFCEGPDAIAILNAAT
jgi:hypothetical protein